MGFQLGNLYVEKGQKTCGFLKLPFTEDELPVTLIYGREEGPTVLVDGGIHNAEYVGIQAAMQLADELDPKKIASARGYQGNSYHDTYRKREWISGKNRQCLGRRRQEFKPCFSRK